MLAGGRTNSTQKPESISLWRWGTGRKQMPWRLERAQIRKSDGFPTSVACCQHLERPWLWRVSAEKKSSILRQVFLSDFSPAFAVFRLINEVTHSFTCSLTDLCIHSFIQQIMTELYARHCSQYYAKSSEKSQDLPSRSVSSHWEAGDINKPSFSISQLASNLLTSLSSYVS